jgi:methionyl-tRNA synthetase
MMDLFDRMWAMQDAICKFNFRDGLKAMLDIASAGNQLLQFNEPWKAYKDEPETVAAVLNLCLQYANALSLAMHPFMPNASGRLRNTLGLEPFEERGAWVQFMDSLSLGETILPDGHVLAQPEHLFSRVEDNWIQVQMNKLNENLPVQEVQESTAPAKANITYDDFAKMDIRTARILTAESVAKADKLLKLTLDVNGKQRTVVSGIAKYYKPEELPGKQVVILANLEPRKIRGVDSEGMILMAEAPDGQLHFIQAASDESGMPVS